MNWYDLFGFDLQYISIWEALFRLVMAMVAGAIIGVDREFKNKPVGLRGFVIVTLGTAGYALASMEMAASYIGTDDSAVDPSRHIQGILGAFGFLGAGAIIQARGSLAGIATGAAIFNAGAAGTAIGFGIIWLGMAISLLSLVTLMGVEKMQRDTPELSERPQAPDVFNPDRDRDKGDDS